MGFSTQAWAVTPFSGGLDSSETMEADTDAYVPSNTNPLGDAGLAGDTPGAQAAHPGLPPSTPAGQDWFDIRNGGVGVIEEVPAGFSGTSAPDGSAHFAIVQFEGGDGPFGRSQRHVDSKPVAGAYTGSRTGYWATTDLYIDPSRQADNNGVPDFWFTNAVNAISTQTYFTESGMTGTVDPSGTTWTIATTAGTPMAVVPVGTWVTMEIEPKQSATIPGGVDFEHRLYDANTGLPIGLFVTAPEYTATVGGFADLAGPRYNWFTFPSGVINHVLVDNVGWEAVPEPASLSLLALGGLALGRRRRA
jgi:hypothetical protein